MLVRSGILPSALSSHCPRNLPPSGPLPYAPFPVSFAFFIPLMPFSWSPFSWPFFFGCPPPHPPTPIYPVQRPTSQHPKPQQHKSPPDPNLVDDILKHRHRYGRQSAPDDITGGLRGGRRAVVDIDEESVVDVETHLDGKSQ